VTTAQRRAAADRKKRATPSAIYDLTTPTGLKPCPPATPGGMPDYFNCGNFANSPLPLVSGNTITGGMKKFVDRLPGLGPANANNLGQYIPIAEKNTGAYSGSDYYEIGLVEYSQQMHSALPPTKLRGYKDLAGGDGKAHYLGPLIIAQRDRPVRIKFVNQLPTGAAGKLFLPVDKTIMGSGEGPMNSDGTPCDPAEEDCAEYTQNRATIHLHGNDAPWISDGTPHQWVAPKGENTPFKRGVSARNVPDMEDPGEGALTFYLPNQMSSRLMFYHDHAMGITRLNVYAGEAAGYLLTDSAEEGLIDSGVLPNLGGVYRYGIPLIIQDKTFVPDQKQLNAQDPTWDSNAWGGFGNLWMPHVYMTNQNPADPDGINAFGRWHYGPWFWPPAANIAHGPSGGNPGTPIPSMTPESWFDTPVINGTAYPVLPVQRKAYRFRVLNACNDRFMNLQLYYADPANPTEVKMVPADPDTVFPPHWPPGDNREGGVPDPLTVGPDMIQIGNETGLLPDPAVLLNTPIGRNLNTMSMTVTNAKEKTLMLAPAERADIIIDFSRVPAGVSKVILYNDAYAPMSAGDTRNDYFTGAPDQTDIGGSPTILPGFGPNTRTLMQFQVSGPAEAPYNLDALKAALPAAYTASRDPAIVPEDPAYWGGIFSNSLTFSTATGSPPMENFVEMKMLTDEPFDPEYGRMMGVLGLELPFTDARTQTGLLKKYMDPPTEYVKDGGVQIWKFTHNGIDTHPLHFHMFNVQLVNRVDWAGVMTPPDPNERGWKETLRFNMLESVYVAIKPKVSTVPFALPQSVRPLNPLMPIGATMGFSNVDQFGLPLVPRVSNQLNNFGHEFVWHCHILSHEEDDMMRPLVVQLAPSTPTAVTARFASVVDPVTNLSVRVAQVNFSLPLELTGGGTPLYTVASSTGAIVGTGNASPIYVTGLTPNTTYSFTVTASNYAGTGPTSLSSNILTWAGVPDAPSSVVAVGGDQTATVSFSPPADNSSPILSYTVTSNPGAITAAGASSPVTVTNLGGPGTSYTFTVTATNAVGTGPASAPSNTVVMTTLPGAPTKLKAVTVGTNNTLLSWTNNTTVNLLGFVVSRSADGGVTWTNLLPGTTVGANTNFYRATGLTPRKTYLFRVQAMDTANALSVFSNTIRATTR
jgi:FtsP/CotA-like multicopper oxidase with cupredoxin domain